MYQKKEVRTGIRFLIGPCPCSLYVLFSLLPPLLRDRRFEQVFGYVEHPGIVDLCTYVFNQIKPLI